MPHIVFSDWLLEYKEFDNLQDHWEKHPSYYECLQELIDPFEIFLNNFIALYTFFDS